jgi:hypothetical protein
MNDWWIRQIEEYKQKSRLSDVAVSKRLDISPAMLAHVRMGRRSLPMQGRLRLLDALGYVVTRDLLLRILPEDMRNAIVDTNAALTDEHLTSDGSEPNAGLELPPEWKQ